MNETVMIVSALSDLGEDSSVPKNVRVKLQEMITSFESSEEKSLAVNKAIYELGQIAEDCNMQSHVRTELFSIVSMLENFDDY